MYVVVKPRGCAAGFFEIWGGKSSVGRGLAAKPNRPAEARLILCAPSEQGLQGLPAGKAGRLSSPPIVTHRRGDWRRIGAAWTGRLFASKLTFAGNSLVGLRDALDPVLKLAAPLGQLPRYHVANAARTSICEVCGESDSLTRPKLVLCHLTAFLACVAWSLKDSFWAPLPMIPLTRQATFAAPTTFECHR
jgi:hypothetical protein